MSLDAEQLLVQARALIDAGWCKGASARDARGIPTPFGGPKAVTYCMSGALCHLSNIVLPAWVGAVKALKQVVGPGIAAWNDKHDRTKEEVLEAYDKAIALVRAGEVRA